MSSNDNVPSQAAKAAKAAGKREIERLTDPKQLGASNSLSAAVLTQRMLDAVISASAHANAARAAAVMVGNEAEETRDAIKRLYRVIIPIVCGSCALGGVGLGLSISHLLP